MYIAYHPQSRLPCPLVADPLVEPAKGSSAIDQVHLDDPVLNLSQGARVAHAFRVCRRLNVLGHALRAPDASSGKHSHFARGLGGRFVDCGGRNRPHSSRRGCSGAAQALACLHLPHQSIEPPLNHGAVTAGVDTHHSASGIAKFIGLCYPIRARGNGPCCDCQFLRRRKPSDGPPRSERTALIVGASRGLG